MKRLTTTLFVVALGCLAWAAADEAKKEIAREYSKIRKITIQNCKTSLDSQYMELNSQYNRARRALKEQVEALHPEIRKIEDNAARNKAIRSYMKELRVKKDPFFLEFIQARIDMDEYLMELNPKLKELYEKLDMKHKEAWFSEINP